MNRLIGLSGTAPLEQVYFRSARLLEGLSEHSAATVYLESDVAGLKPDDFLGESLCLCFETRNQNRRYFDGVVVEMAQESISIGGRCTYRVELRSWTWLLGRNREFRVYQQQSIHDILAEITGRHSHSSIRFSDRTVGPRRVRDYMVQYGESDLDFLLRMLEQEGIYFYFEHAQNQHTMVLVDSPTAHAVFPDYESLDHDPAHSGLRLTPEEKITSLWFAKSITAPRHAHSDYNFKTPASSLLSECAGKTEPFNSSYEVFEYPGEFSQQDEGLQYSRLRQEELQAHQQVYIAQTNARGVCTGCLLTPRWEGNPALSKTLLIIRTAISILEAEPESSGGAQSAFECQFQAIEASQSFRPQRKTSKPIIHGPLPALVVGPEGREIHTDEFGRIKIQFYWDRYGKRNQNSSCWVRVASPAAGKGWGFFALPRIGQEVVVSFEAGDPDRPLVTGVAYNASQSVPYPLPDHQTVSGWRTRSTEQGNPGNFNELRFEDKTGSEYVWFQAERDFLALIKNHSRSEIGGDVHKLVHGSLVEEIREDTSRRVLGQVSQQIEKALHLTVNDDLLANVKGLLGLINQGQISISTTGQFSLKCGKGTDIHSSSNLSLEAAGQGNFKAGSNLKLSAGSSLTLSVGGSSISITPAGITLSGPSISLNGSGGGGPAASATPNPPEAAIAPTAVVPPVDPIS